MEKRNRERLVMSAFCQIAPAANQSRTAWKRIENISGTGMLVVWSRGEPDVRLPEVGEQYTVELQLPAHPVFGQRALRFKTKVVRVYRHASGRVMAGFESSKGRIKHLRAAAWTESSESATVN